jgi:hypothetical protein
MASEPGAEVAVVCGATGPGETMLRLSSTPSAGSDIAAGSDTSALTDAVAAGVAAGTGADGFVVVVEARMVAEDHATQTMAAALLDGICRGLGGL